MTSAARRALLSMRVTSGTKERFAALAAQRGTTESALLDLVVRDLLDQNAAPPEPAEASEDGSHGRASERIALRLRPGDRALLEDRAACRGMKLATYVVMLLRAHVRSNPPMPVAELDALKAAVGELSAVERRLGQLDRSGDARRTQPSQAQIADARRCVEQVRCGVADIVRVHLRSWEAGA